MPRYEPHHSQFGLAGGVPQPSSERVLIAAPHSAFAPEARKGTLLIVTDTEAQGPRAADACRLVAETVRTEFVAESSFSLTTALRRGIVAANKALYQFNFGAPPDRRVMVGVTCAVIKEGDLYLAQVTPGQAYVLSEAKLRPFPTPPGWNGVARPPRPRGLGGSLTVEPDFYRATLGPEDVALLTSANVAPLLDRAAAGRLLDFAEPAAIIEELQDALLEAGVADATALAFTLRPRGAAAATDQRAPGIAERAAAAARDVSAGVSRITGEIAALGRRPDREQAARGERAEQQARREDERMLVMPPEHHESPRPPESPLPIDLGESLNERLATERRIRQPPPAPTGPAVYPPESGRRYDLSDTPGMGPRRSATDIPLAEPRPRGVGARLADVLDRLDGTLRRRREAPFGGGRQPPQLPGLSYRKNERPKTPWAWFIALIALVALAFVYGYGLSRENNRKEASNDLLIAEQLVAAIRQAPDEAEADKRLKTAGEMLGKVRSSGVVTETVENRRRFDDAQREFERAAAAIQKLTYFDDLSVVGSHPQAAAGAAFTSVTVPPRPTGITNTEAFGSIYALDGNLGVLYRMPKTGGDAEPLLKPTDQIASGVPVGQIRAVAWRLDNIVAVAQSESGPYIYYFRDGNQWRFSNMGGSEDWGRNVGKLFKLSTYGGNLYIWGAASGQVLKYTSGSFGDIYDPWIKNFDGRNADPGIDMAVDGQLYILLPDGKIQIYARNTFDRELPVPTVTPPLVTPSGGFFVTGGPEGGSIFLVDTLNERIIQIDKLTGRFVQQIRARLNGPVRLNQLAALFVDETGLRPTLFMVNGGQIVRATLPDPPRSFKETDATPFVPAPVDITPTP